MTPIHMTGERACRLARVGGALYLLIIVLGFLGEAVIRERIVAPGDPIATATNLQMHAGLWRLGVASEVVLLSATTGLALILYLILRPVGRELATLAVMFNLMVVAVEAVAAGALANALAPFSSAAYASAFTREQLGGMALMAVRSHTALFTIALAFFGVECLLLTPLIRRSGFLPKALATLIGLAGTCYIVNSLAWLLTPRLSSMLFPMILLPSLVGELSLALWLLARGVDRERWDASRQALLIARA